MLIINADDWGVRIIIPNSAIYAEHSDKFREEAMPFIGKLSELLAKTKRKILIEGHVAEKETGPFHSTWDFASARAVNMLRYIQKKQNMAAPLLAAASLADTRPLYHGEKKEQNSRLEIVLLNQEFEF